MKKINIRNKILYLINSNPDFLYHIKCVSSITKILVETYYMKYYVS